MSDKVFDADVIQVRIDKDWEDRQEDGRRKHLGGSMIGRECMRELWYSFRWALTPKHKGRILRLFDRGHKEEFRFVDFLRAIDVAVRDYAQQLWWSPSADDYQLWDWDRDLSGGTGDYIPVTAVEWHVKRATERDEGPKQWRISDVYGHFGGSLDGIAYGLEFEYAPGCYIMAADPFLLEFKTHGSKSFNKLVKDGLIAAKPEHYAQMQTYMTKRGIKVGLYMAVNKDNDELKCFWVQCDPAFGLGMIGKAQHIIQSPTPPARISTRPTFFKCQWCDFKGPCHMGIRMEKNCRTCAFSKPVEEGQWFCAKWGANIPDDAQRVGCDEYHGIEG